MSSDKSPTRKILVGGNWTETAESFPLFSPYSGEKLADVALAGEKEIEIALQAAKTVNRDLRRLSRYQIAEYLGKIAVLIEKRKKEFTETIAQESAKPLIYARGETERAIQTFIWASEEAKRFEGEKIPVDTQPSGRGKVAFSERIPRGVILGITPFNFPLNLVAHKVAPALAAKNAIIIKPSPKTPLTSLLLGEVFLESGFPKSALQILNIPLELIENTLKDERIDMISFTGSAKIGWELKEKSGKKQVALELGGNAPVIIDETCDWKKTLDKSLTAAFAFSGQICISAQRFYLHESIFADWTAEFSKRCEKLKNGNPLDEKTNFSVMIDENAAERVENWVNEAVEGGAKLLYGGKREKNFFSPTILTNTDFKMKIVSEEAFAPLVTVEKFTEFEEAVKLANQSQYGLQCGVFTESYSRIRYAIENLDFGGVIINDVPIFRVDNMPYGGVKNSGFGREGIRYAMEEMSEIKLIVLN